MALLRFMNSPIRCGIRRGAVRYGRDPLTGRERIDLVKLRGYGVEGSANANKWMEVNGFISPINRYSAVNLNIKSSDLWIDKKPPGRHTQRGAGGDRLLRRPEGQGWQCPPAPGTRLIRCPRDPALWPAKKGDRRCGYQHRRWRWRVYRIFLSAAQHQGQVFVRSNFVDIKTSPPATGQRIWRSMGE